MIISDTPKTICFSWRNEKREKPIGFLYLSDVSVMYLYSITFPCILQEEI